MELFVPWSGNTYIGDEKRHWKLLKGIRCNTNVTHIGTDCINISQYCHCEHLPSSEIQRSQKFHKFQRMHITTSRPSKTSMLTLKSQSGPVRSSPSSIWPWVCSEQALLLIDFSDANESNEKVSTITNPESFYKPDEALVGGKEKTYAEGEGDLLGLDDSLIWGGGWNDLAWFYFLIVWLLWLIGGEFSFSS